MELQVTYLDSNLKHQPQDAILIHIEISHFVYVGEGGFVQLMSYSNPNCEHIDALAHFSLLQVNLWV